MTGDAAATIDDYWLRIGGPDNPPLLRGISLEVGRGRTVGLVGESGSGKTLTARSLLGMLPAGAECRGSVVTQGVRVLSASVRDLQRLRREKVGIVFQDPSSSFNPLRTIGDFVTEVLRAEMGVSSAAANESARTLIQSVGLRDAELVMTQYPGQLSGGMLQRILIATALAGEPQLLVCDEPTTALDVTTQAEILVLLEGRRRELGMSMLFVTHDLEVAAAICDEIYVMRAGVVVEHGPAATILSDPEEKYTQQLLAARLDPLGTRAVDSDEQPRSAP